ncbi:MAG TPA: alpha/beta hydrolase [bacterium]
MRAGARHLAVASCAAAALAAGFLSGMLDQQYLYFPDPLERADWARASGLPLEDVRMRAEDGVELHGWFIEAPEARAALLWCHGNAGNISHRLENLRLVHARGYSVLIFDYRGYGDSGGRPSEPGLHADAEAAFRHLTEARGVPPRRLILFGRSLGAAVAGTLAARHGDVAGLILETPFPSVEAVARSLYGGLPVHRLLRARFDLRRDLARVRVPVLVVHGDRDRIIPFALGEEVFAAAGEPKRFYRIAGADHNDTYVIGGAAYFDALDDFITFCLNPASSAP